MKRYLTQLSHDSNKIFAKSNESVLSIVQSLLQFGMIGRILLTLVMNDQLLTEASREISGRRRLPQLRGSRFIHGYRF